MSEPASKAKPKLRSGEWFGSADKNGFMYRSWMKNQGIPDHAFQGRPVIGICNTWSELTPCTAHFRMLTERVKRGVYEAGGFPVEFPVFSNGESNLRPTAMFTRNLASMDVEEAIRGNPIDGVVLLVGCDKTTPALLMGAASCDLPAIVVSGGPMLNGKHQGRDIGSGTAVWQLSEQVKAGTLTLHEFPSAESGKVVFENLEDNKARTNDPALPVAADSVLVLKNCGPRGYPGMAEVGNMGLPPKLLAQGVTDMVRISDARMSGTAYGTVVLHVTPEARAGGPLAVVREGDWIELDSAAGRLHLDISDHELQARLAEWAAAQRPEPLDGAGYRKLYVEHVLQADEGCDFDFLVGCRGATVPRHSH